MTDVQEETTPEAEATEATELTGRRLERAEALEEARQVLAATPDEDVSLEVAALRRLVAATAPKVRGSSGPREKLEPADPEQVRDYFLSTGLTRKQIAAAAGVSTSVISTVQNPKGDRWSEQTFALKRGMIDAYVTEHADDIAAARKADEDAAAAKVAEAQAKADRKAAREQAAATKAAAPPKAAKAAPAAQSGGAASATPQTRKQRKAAAQAAASTQANP